MQRHPINIGPFTLVLTLEGDGWAVPGGRIVYSERTARRIAGIIARRMVG